MIEFVTSRWLGDFLFGFSALFAIINPYGLAFIFHDRTVGLSERERAQRGSPHCALCFRSASGITLRREPYSSLLWHLHARLAHRRWSCGRGGRLVDASRGADPSGRPCDLERQFCNDPKNGILPADDTIDDRAGDDCNCHSDRHELPGGFGRAVLFIHRLDGRRAWRDNDHLSRVYEIQCDGAALRRRGHKCGNEAVCIFAALYWGPNCNHGCSRGCPITHGWFRVAPWMLDSAR